MDVPLEEVKTHLRALQWRQLKLEKVQWKLHNSVQKLREAFESFKRFRAQIEGMTKDNVMRERLIKDLKNQIGKLKSSRRRGFCKTTRKRLFPKGPACEICPKKLKCSGCVARKRQGSLPEMAKNPQMTAFLHADGSRTFRRSLGQTVRVVDDEILDRYLEDSVKFQEKRLSRTGGEKSVRTDETAVNPRSNPERSCRRTYNLKDLRTQTRKGQSAGRKQRCPPKNQAKTKRNRQMNRNVRQ